ncbi:MAG: hypothetical protein AB7U35_02490 [Sphingobium sp.]
MKIACKIFAATLSVAMAAPALAAPGLGDKVYGARLEKGVTEIEMRYGRLTGDAADGEDAAVIEIAHNFSDKLSLGVLMETEREPHEGRKVEAYALESIVHLGRIDALNLDVALYGEYEAVRHGADAIETKLLLQHSKGPFDARLNLVVEKELESGEPLEFGYAAAVDWQAFGEFRIGAEAFGELGSTRDFLPREEHFAGPMVRTEIEHLPGRGDEGGELEIEAGYLFALGSARDETNGQFRLVLEYEFRF